MFCPQNNRVNVELDFANPVSICRSFAAGGLVGGGWTRQILIFNRRTALFSVCFRRFNRREFCYWAMDGGKNEAVWRENEAPHINIALRLSAASLQALHFVAQQKPEGNQATTKQKWVLGFSLCGSLFVGRFSQSMKVSVPVDTLRFL